VVLADDHPRYRRGLAKLLDQSGVEVAGEAANGWAALRSVASTSPDVVLLDLDLAGMSGAEVARRLTSCDPPHRVLVLSVSVDEADVTSALLAGAQGYLLKGGPVEEVVAGIGALAAGESYFSPRIRAMLLRRMPGRGEHTTGLPDSLSKRERDVLRRRAKGRPDAKMGQGLATRPRTAGNHVSSILAKLGVENRVQPAVRPVREDLV
jgi:DNA-binding NarL/FixJ family response regulator